MPATATDLKPFISSLKDCARERTGNPLCSAAFNSGLLSFIAVEITTVFANEMLFALCPISTLAPSARKLSMTMDSLASEPDTWIPRSKSILAIALMPEPPMPMK